MSQHEPSLSEEEKELFRHIRKDLYLLEGFMEGLDSQESITRRQRIAIKLIESIRENLNKLEL